MKVNLYLDGNPDHDKAIRGMAAGICNASVLLRNYADYEPCDVAVMFGMYKRDVRISWPRKDILEGQRSRGLDTIVLDSGYIFRDNYYAVGLNGLNGRADFKNHNSPSDRWDALGIELQPWRVGETILVVGQVPWDASVQNVDITGWAEKTVNELRELTDRRIVYRPHPKAKSPPIEGAEYSQKPLEQDLREARAVVTWNSNVGVDAVLAGVPVFAFDEGSMVYDIANHDLSEIERPWCHTRYQWAHDIAYAQWKPEEMGEAWLHLEGNNGSSDSNALQGVPDGPQEAGLSGSSG